jgi:hypothetical protein
MPPARNAGRSCYAVYVGLTLARPEPFAYLVAHGLKVLGGAREGSAFAGWRRAATNATDVASH